MKKIRKNVFETNSSSTHSITLAHDLENKRSFDDHVNKDKKTIDLYPDEFGWDVCEFDDPYTKASYIYTYALEKKSEKIKNRLAKVIKDESGLDVNFCLMDTEYYENGYIDHQSIDECSEIAEDYDDLKLFIFSIDSILYTDNDNH